MSDVTIIGIDPGLTGAVARISIDGAEVVDLPVMANGKGSSKVKNQVNASELARILDELASPDGTIVFLERISSMPGQGVASMFSMGDTFGCIRGVCGALWLPTEVVTPQKWKKHFMLGADKEVVRARAIEAFPEQPLGRKKDHNRAEALLIAKYGWDIRNH